MSDEFDFEGSGLPGEDEDQDETGSESEDDAQGTSGDDEDDRVEKLEKRVNDLMSKWQTEEAARKTAEEKLAKAQEGSGAGMEQYLELIRAQARDQVYRSDPRFGEFGLGVELIEGDSPESMRQSAKRLSDVLDKVAASAEDKALKKHGITPEIKSGASQRMPDMSKMSDEDFLKLIEKAKSG